MGIHPLPEAPDRPVEVKPCKVTPSKVPGSCADFCRCKTLRSSENLCCTGNFGESRPRPEDGRRQNVGKSEELKSRQPCRREAHGTNTYASCRNKSEASGDRERVRDKCVASMLKVTDGPYELAKSTTRPHATAIPHADGQPKRDCGGSRGIDTGEPHGERSRRSIRLFR